MISVDEFSARAFPGAAELDRSIDLAGRRLVLLASRSAEDRVAAGRALARSWGARFPGGLVLLAAPAATWPFLHPLVPALPERPAIIWAPDVHEAAINQQTAGARLVTTQLAYLFAMWRLAFEGRDDVLLIATADPDALGRHAPEALTGRGPFKDALIPIAPAAPDAPAAPAALDAPAAPAAPVACLLAQAFRMADPGERLSLSARALEHGRTAPALVAIASTRMEINDLDAASRDLDEAVRLAPDWPAVHFERGKLWLRLDDMARASASFREAAERLPTFVSAWANLGATLGELDEPEAALAAFRHALTSEPGNHQVLNNVGVVCRELGRLAESERALRQVIALVPELAFGHYNLGHTLFLQGRYHAALAAYVEGQRRDPERNPVQASRLALSKLGTGDAAGALLDLQGLMAGLPPDYRRRLLTDTAAIALALLAHKPDLPGWARVNDWLQAELARLD